MRIYRRGVLATVAAAVAFALAGCVAGAAEPAAPSASPTPAAVAGPSIAVLAVGGTGVVAVDENGEKVSSMDYTSDGATAVAYLTDVFGSEPVVTGRPSDFSCSAEAKRATWGDDAVELLFDFEGEYTGLPDGQYVWLEVKADAVGGVALETPTGFGVGDQEGDLVASLPGVSTDINEVDPTVTFVNYEWVDGAYADPMTSEVPEGEVLAWGARAVSSSSVIVELVAPEHFQNFC